MHVGGLAPRDVQTTLNYYQPRDQVPCRYVDREPPPGVPEDNIVREPRSAVIRDARGKQDSFDLDTSGFKWVNHPSVAKDLESMDEEWIKTVYYAEVEDVLKKYTGAKRVHIFEYAVRSNSTGQTATDNRVRRPARFVHCDQTYTAAEKYARRFLPEDAERLLKGRYQIINVWRPIANTVAHEPLAIADFCSVDVDADLAAVRVVLPDRETESFHLKYNPRHDWYYLSDQTPDEATLIKCFDSDVDKARMAPHSAFLDETSPADAPQRQSIEVRALVFDSE